VVVVAFRSSNGTVSSITDNAAGGSSLYTKRASLFATNSKVELWATAAGGSRNATSVTVNLSAFSMHMVVTVASYSGVVSLGRATTASVNAGSVSPGNPPAQISLTTADSNNWVVAGFAAGVSSAFTASAGVIRQQAVGSGPVAGALVDNTRATPGTVDNILTIDVGSAWTSMAALELRTVPASYYFDSASSSGTFGTTANCVMTMAAVVPGHTNVVVVAMNPQSAGTLRIEDGPGDTPASTYTRQILATGAQTRVEIWTATIAAGASPTVQVHFSNTQKGPCMVAQYAGVSGLGAQNTATGTSASPTISLTTQYANSVVVAGFSNQGSADLGTSTGTPTQSIGILRRAGATSSGGDASNACGALVEDTRTTAPATVTTAVNLLESAVWVAATLELRGPQWLWSAPTSAASLAPPALDPWSNIVVSGSNDTKLYGVRDTDGVKVFAPFTTGGAIQERPAMVPAGFRTPATAVNIAYVTSQDGFVYAIDTSTGAQVWRSPSLAPANMLQGGAGVWLQAFAPLPICGTTVDVVFVGTRDTGTTSANKIYALNGSGSTVTTTGGGNCTSTSVSPGGVLWTFTGGGPNPALHYISSVPYLDYVDTVWVTSRANAGTQPALWRLDAANGTLRATWTLGQLGDGDVSASAGIDGGPMASFDRDFVYVGTNAGVLSAVRMSDGTVVSHTPAGGAGAIKGSPYWLSFNPVAVATPDTIIFSRNTTVHSVNFTGAAFSSNWTRTLTWTPSPPVDDGTGRLYVGGSDSRVHQLRVSDGVDEAQVTVAAGTLTVGEPTINWDLGRIHVGASDGRVYSFAVPF
jgi:hypothetical protein